MMTHPTTAELLRYVEADLPAARAEEIEKAIALDEAMAVEVEVMRADLRLAKELKAAARSDTDAATERRITKTLTSTVTDHVSNAERRRRK